MADDETGELYIGEEGTAVWKFNAMPGQGDQKTAIARVQPDGELTADIEGVSIYHQEDGNGYIVVSSQGSDSFAVYDRQVPHQYRGMFRIRADMDSGIDGVSETDGLDVSSTSLPGFPEGLMVTQDGRNIEPAENQNFKFISWSDIKAALNLP
ncbi:MAG: phytase [Gammaproteobacteria bacterium]|nr:phytase [Gammaproteobacteria bacterium]